MNRNELLQVLAAGQEVGFVLSKVNLTSEIRFVRFIILMKFVPDSQKHSWHWLQESPSYVRHQKIIQSKPFRVSVLDAATIPDVFDWIYVYFADLEEVEVFLQQFGKGIEDFYHLSDADILRELE